MWGIILHAFLDQEKRFFTQTKVSPAHLEIIGFRFHFFSSSQKKRVFGIDGVVDP